MATCGQIFPRSLSSSVSGAVGVCSLSSDSALVGYADGALGLLTADASVDSDRLLSVDVRNDGAALAGIHCLSACIAETNSSSSYMGMFAAGHRRGVDGISLGRIMVNSSRVGGGGQTEATLTVGATLPVASGKASGRATCLHLDKQQVVYGTAEGAVTLRKLFASSDVRQFHLAMGKSGPHCRGSGPQVHAVSTCPYASDIVVAAGFVLSFLFPLSSSHTLLTKPPTENMLISSPHPTPQGIFCALF